MMRVINSRIRHSEIILNKKTASRNFGIGKLLDDLEQDAVKNRKLKFLKPQSHTNTRSQIPSQYKSKQQ